MEDKLYNVIFLGPAHNGADYVNKLTEGLMDRFNLPVESVTKMMRWAPITVKKGLTFKEAAKYRVVLESLGAKVKIEPQAIANGEDPPLRPETEAAFFKRTPYLLLIATAIIIIAVVVIVGLR
ncbi:MAG: hypothetical protein DRG50_06825 [Deltaproteobacteria bacterium]|nr:MAG: hypothetical protein DRG50_06825 [Deltaproteobacteria bacterium]